MDNSNNKKQDSETNSQEDPWKTEKKSLRYNNKSLNPNEQSSLNKEEEVLKQAIVEWKKKGNTFLANACEEALIKEEGSNDDNKRTISNSELDELQEKVEKIEADREFYRVNKQQDEEPLPIEEDVMTEEVLSREEPLPIEEDVMTEEELKASQEQLFSSEEKGLINFKSLDYSYDKKSKILTPKSKYLKQITGTKFIFRIASGLFLLFIIKYSYLLLRSF